MEWRQIPILPSYEISDTGIVRNRKTLRILKQHIYCAPGRHKHYDKRIRLFNNFTGKTYKVHRLMAITWFDNFDENLEIDHIDGNSLNNELTNLRQCTHKENMNNPISVKKMSLAQKRRFS